MNILHALKPKGIRGWAIANIGFLSALFGFSYAFIVRYDTDIVGLQTITQVVSLDALGALWMLIGLGMILSSMSGGWHRIAMNVFTALNIVWACLYAAVIMNQLFVSGSSNLMPVMIAHFMLATFNIFLAAMHEPSTLRKAAELSHPVKKE